jgi:hypothetical protein
LGRFVDNLKYRHQAAYRLQLIAMVVPEFKITAAMTGRSGSQVEADSAEAVGIQRSRERRAQGQEVFEVA